MKKVLFGIMFGLLFVGFLLPAIYIPQVIGDTVGVGVTGLNLSKTVVGGGYDMNVTVSVENFGDKAETFDLTLYANATCVASQNVTLSGRDFENVTFTWDTAGFAFGPFTLGAYASPVPGETNMMDNNCTGGRVTVSTVGDVTGPDGGPDGKVDMRDIGYIVGCFGGKQGAIAWNPNADLNGDGIVNMRDVGIAVTNFGQRITFFNQATPTDPATEGFAGVKVSILMNSLSVNPFAGTCLPQMNLWYKAGDSYYWLQTILYYGNEFGYVDSAHPPDGLGLGFSVWNFTDPYVNQVPCSYRIYFFLAKTPIQFTLFTFIGVDLDMHTELYVYDNILALNVDWQEELCPSLPRATGGEQLMKFREFYNNPNLVLWPWCNQIIFTEPAPVSMGGNGGILSTDGDMEVQTLINGAFQNPSLALTLSHLSGYPFNFSGPYFDNSAEFSSHLSWQINANTVTFSPATSSDFTGMTIIDNIP